MEIHRELLTGVGVICHKTLPMIKIVRFGEFPVTAYYLGMKLYF